MEESRLEKWLSLLRSLKELLIVVCHVWGGMPGRGPEVTTMRHCDGLQLMRNVFIYGRSVMIATDRDKAIYRRSSRGNYRLDVPRAITKVEVAAAVLEADDYAYRDADEDDGA